MEEDLKRAEVLRLRKTRLREERRQENEMQRKLVQEEQQQALRSKREDMRAQNAQLERQLTTILNVN